MGAGEENRPFVEITNREIYDGLRSVERKVDAVDRKVDGVDGKIDKVTDDNSDLKKRVRALEFKSYALMAGLMAAIVVLIKVSGFPA